MLKLDNELKPVAGVLVLAQLKNHSVTMPKIAWDRVSWVMGIKIDSWYVDSVAQ